MYLPTTSFATIFATTKKQRPLDDPKEYIKSALICFGLSLLTLPLFSQQVWPGDVSNNGIVDNKDILFWAYARGATGAARVNASSQWAAQEVDFDAWSSFFPDSDLSFAHADCNGDGVVDDLDLAVIMDNYWKTLPSGSVSSDPFSYSPNASVSTLGLIQPGSNTVSPGGTKDLLLNLDTQQDQDLGVSSMAFSLTYPPSLIADDGFGNSLLYFFFDESNNSWFAGQQAGNAHAVMYTDADLGITEVALYLDEAGTSVAGQGAIGNFSIVVEEVIFGLQTVDLGNVVILDGDFAITGPTTGSGTGFYVQDELVASTDQLSPASLLVFPNPTESGQIQASLVGGQAGQIEQVELINIQGNSLAAKTVNGRSAQLQVGHLPSGTYFLRIATDAGLTTKRLMIVNP
jgi:hypothetical protein